MTPNELIEECQKSNQTYGVRWTSPPDRYTVHTGQKPEVFDRLSKKQIIAVYDNRAIAEEHISYLNTKAVLATVRKVLSEPDEKMWNAAWRASEDYFVGDKISKEGLRLALSAMLAAAPLGEIQDA